MRCGHPGRPRSRAIGSESFGRGFFLVANGRAKWTQFPRGRASSARLRRHAVLHQSSTMARNTINTRADRVSALAELGRPPVPTWVGPFLLSAAKTIG